MAHIRKLQLVLMQLENPQSIGGKNGTKRHLLTDENGIPLSITITSGNTHDIKEFYNLIKKRSIKPKKHQIKGQNLLVDKGYKGKNTHKKIRNNLRIRIRVKNLKKRWKVEVCHSWFNNFRKLKVRYEKKRSIF